MYLEQMALHETTQMRLWMYILVSVTFCKTTTVVRYTVH